MPIMPKLPMQYPKPFPVQNMHIQKNETPLKQSFLPRDFSRPVIQAAECSKYASSPRGKFTSLPQLCAVKPLHNSQHIVSIFPCSSSPSHEATKLHQRDELQKLTNRMGAGPPIPIATKPKRLFPHPYPNFAYIVGAKSGNTKAARQRRTEEAATAEAEYVGQASTMQVIRALKPIIIPVARRRAPMEGNIH